MVVVSFSLDMPRQRSKKEPQERSRKRGAQKHPDGPLEWVDDDWVARVKARMPEVEIPDQKRLAKKAGVSGGAITHAFKPGRKQIRIKGKIHAALGWPEPQRVDEMLRKINERFPDLTEATQAAIFALVESVTPKP